MRRRARQAGFALAAISLIGMAAMGSAALMISENGIEENAAIEESLLRVRAHWALMGHASYVLSRFRQDDACDTNCSNSDITRKDTLLNINDEFLNANNVGIKIRNGVIRRHEYLEISDKYAVNTNITVDDAVLPNDGKLRLQVFFPATALVTPFIQSRLAKFPSIALTLCAGLEDPGDACPVFVLDTNLSGIVRIADFTVIR